MESLTNTVDTGGGIQLLDSTTSQDQARWTAMAIEQTSWEMSLPAMSHFT